MNLGEKWNKALADREAAKKSGVIEAFAREAAEVIAKIPERVEAAGRNGEARARILERWVNYTDINMIKHPGGVDQLVESIAPVGENKLVEADLAGAAKAIFKWCEATGLQLSIRYVDKVPLNGPEYSLFVEPKGLK